MLRLVRATALLGSLIFAGAAHAESAPNLRAEPPTATFDELPSTGASVNPLPQPSEPVRAPSAQPEPPLGAPPPAAAKELPPPVPALRRWYGWQILAADAGSAGLFTLGALSPSTSDGESNAPSVLMIAGGGGYFLGAPIIHLAHHRLGAAAGSLAMRVILPLVVGEVGMSRQTCPAPGSEDWGNCGLLGAVEGAAIGALAASLIDASLNSIAPQLESREQEQYRARGLQFGLSPALSADGKRAELRLLGTF